MDYIFRTPIKKGWSSDKKYRVSCADGRDCLLRVSGTAEFDKKKLEYDLMRRFFELGVPMCRPIEFGISDEGVYSLQSWIDGEDAEDAIPRLSRCEQYGYGLQAGRILRLIHSLPAPAQAEDWETRMNRKFDVRILKYLSCREKYDHGQVLVDYVNRNCCLLKDRPQVWQHGDYHIGNMMLDRAGRLQIIDFNRFDVGDPWEEFKSIVWCVKISHAFASGQVDGYFEGNVPKDFWRLLALYIACSSISSLPWAIQFGDSEITTMKNQAKDILRWYDNMNKTVPAWYIGGEKGVK